MAASMILFEFKKAYLYVYATNSWSLEEVTTALILAWQTLSDKLKN